MDAKSLIKSFQSAFSEGNKTLQVSGLTVKLLPFGQSFSGEINEDVVVVHEDLFRDNPSFFANYVLRKLGQVNSIDAEKTTIKEVSKLDFEDFCRSYHFKKGTNPKIRLGLFVGERLMLVAGFSKPKVYYQNDQKCFRAELYRVVSYPSLKIIGGVKKLVDFFVEEYMVSELSTFVANEFEELDGLLNAGMDVEENFDPVFEWLHIESNDRFSTGQLLKKGLIRNESITEMVHPPKGYLPIRGVGGKRLLLEVE